MDRLSSWPLPDSMVSSSACWFSWASDSDWNVRSPSMTAPRGMRRPRSPRRFCSSCASLTAGKQGLASIASLIGGGMSGSGGRSARCSGGASVWSLRRPIGRGPMRDGLSVRGSSSALGGCCPGRWWKKRSSTSASWSESRRDKPNSSVSREVSSPFCCRTSSNCCRVSSSCRSISLSRRRILTTASVCDMSAEPAESRATMRSTKNCTRVSLSLHCFVVSLSFSTFSELSLAILSVYDLNWWLSAVSVSIRWLSSCSLRSTSSMCASICDTNSFSFFLYATSLVLRCCFRCFRFSILRSIFASLSTMRCASSSVGGPSGRASASSPPPSSLLASRRSGSRSTASRSANCRGTLRP
mmetsp:Transcript_43177/g.122115  ORF Transcript_43177/g.122115 Transcript_43177/m.122115 type:complete len:356 (+) Transcript_43177:555-1622(+)